MTISSVVLILGFADLGMGNGLLNAISEANGKDDRQAAVNYVSSGFFMLLGVALLIVLTFILAYPYVSWPSVFNIKSKLAAQEAGPAIAILCGHFCFEPASGGGAANPDGLPGGLSDQHLSVPGQHLRSYRSVAGDLC